MPSLHTAPATEDAITRVIAFFEHLALNGVSGPELDDFHALVRAECGERRRKADPHESVPFPTAGIFGFFIAARGRETNAEVVTG